MGGQARLAQRQMDGMSPEILHRARVRRVAFGVLGRGGLIRHHKGGHVSGSQFNGCTQAHWTRAHDQDVGCYFLQCAHQITQRPAV